MIRSSIIFFLAGLAVVECSSRPPKPKIVYLHRKHPKKSADTIPLGPPVIREADPVVICARRFVRALLDDDQGTAKAMISPKWLEEDGISMDAYMVSKLDLLEVPTHAPYLVTDVRGDTVTITTTSERGYPRYVSVLVREEDGRRYVVPSGADHCCYSVDPWYWPPDPYFAKREQTRKARGPASPVPPAIKEDGPMVTCARRFVRAMLNNDQRSAVRMLSPRWLKRNGIDMDSFAISRLDIVNFASRTPFKVVNVNGHVVSVLTAPDSDHGKRLSVKTSYEDGKYYVEPGGTDIRSRSVDPWYRPPEPNFVQRSTTKPATDASPPPKPAIREDDPAVICASRFVRAMLDNDQRTAEELISPEWLKETNRSLDTYMVSRLDIIGIPPHTPLVIADVRGDTVFVQPNDSSCLQPLMVRVSKEDGNYYIEPSGADDCCGSIDPWTWPPEQ